MVNFSYDLSPLHTSQKSFYGKATVHAYQHGGDNYYTLLSYGTPVVSVYVGSGNIPHIKRIWDGYSATTMRHVNELLSQHGFPKLSAHAWRAMEVGKFYSQDDVPAIEKSLK